MLSSHSVFDAGAFGGRVRALREASGQTQSGLAAAIDVDQSAISRIEGGTRSVSVGELARLARVFAVDAVSLLEGEREPFAELEDSSDEDVQTAIGQMRQVMFDFDAFTTLMI